MNAHFDAFQRAIPQTEKRLDKGMTNFLMGRKLEGEKNYENATSEMKQSNL